MEQINKSKALNAKELEQYARELGLNITTGHKNHGRRIESMDGKRFVYLPDHGNRKGLPTGTKHFILNRIDWLLNGGDMKII